MYAQYNTVLQYTCSAKKLNRIIGAITEVINTAVKE